MEKGLTFRSNSERGRRAFAGKQVRLNPDGRIVPNLRVAMGQIIRDFPDTPMAKLAQEHIDRAAEMARKKDPNVIAP